MVRMAICMQDKKAIKRLLNVFLLPLVFAYFPQFCTSTCMYDIHDSNERVFYYIYEPQSGKKNGLNVKYSKVVKS